MLKIKLIVLVAVFCMGAANTIVKVRVNTISIGDDYDGDSYCNNFDEYDDNDGVLEDQRHCCYSRN